MPWDGTTETPAIRRARLIEALRGEMPQDFKWDFSSYGCGTFGCAYALAERIGLNPDAADADHWSTAAKLAHILGVPQEDRYIFCSPSYHGVSGWSAVTPGMVADALEKISD